MKAVQVVSRGKAQFVDAPKPQLQPGYVLVRPHLVALCGSDNWMLNHCPPEEYPFPPGTTGHEVIAQVEAIDADILLIQLRPEFTIFSKWHKGQ